MTASSLLDPDQIVFPKLGLDFRINDTAFTVFGFDIKWYSLLIVFGLQVHIGQNQLVLDLLPQDAGHLVAVHLHQRRFHQNLVQNNPVPFAIVFDRTEGSLAIVAGLYRNSNTRYSKRTARLCGRGVCAIIEVRCRHT